MVLALLAGTKSQTRRIVSPRNSLFDGGPVQKKLWTLLDWGRAYIDKGPSPAGNPGPYWRVPYTTDDQYWARIYPRIQTGDEIWVKETFKHYANSYNAGNATANVLYLADNALGRISVINPPSRRVWTTNQSSLLMPRWASRITLAVPAVRSERLNDIRAEDALAEGIDHYSPGTTASERGESEGDPVEEYRTLWETINGSDSWRANPPVWVYDLKQK